MAMSTAELQAGLKLLHGILSERWTPRRLDEHSWEFQHVAGWVPLSCYAEINPAMEAFLFRAINPLPVESARRGLVAEYITRVNYPLPIGNWAIDLDSGDVRWKAGLCFGGAGLGESLIRHVIDASLFFVYQHAVGIAKLQTGGTVAEALATVGQDHGRGMSQGIRQPG
jgi:hypothetical protein